MINEAGLITYTTSPGVRIDPTPPDPLQIVAVDPEFHMTLIATHQGHTDSLAAWWEFEEPESYIVGYKVAVGLKPNGTEVLDWTDMGLEKELVLLELDLENLETYYFTVEATNAAGLRGIGHTDGIIVSWLQKTLFAATHYRQGATFRAMGKGRGPNTDLLVQSGANQS